MFATPISGDIVECSEMLMYLTIVLMCRLRRFSCVVVNLGWGISRSFVSVNAAFIAVSIIYIMSWREMSTLRRLFRLETVLTARC